MSITKNHRKSMDGSRATIVELMTSTLEVLEGADVSVENRKLLANDAKETLDAYIKMETASNQYEYIMGRVAGIVWGAFVIPFAGRAIRKGVKHLINRNT